MSQELRHFCRHCRGKLTAPTGNPREAFDSKGCHGAFYRHRCLVCERDMPRNSESQRTCFRAKCKTTWQQKTIQSRFVGDSSLPVSTPLENPIKSGIKSADKYGRRWVIIAGTISPNALRCATVPDGPGCRWEGGSFERIEAENRRTLAKAEQAEIEANGYFTEPDWKEVISPDGVRCFATRFREPRHVTVTNDLSIADADNGSLAA